MTIGLPLAGGRVYVVDPRGEPAPAGVPGEMLLAGEGLARGYLGRPELTAERFVPHPFSTRPGERLYRTGDLVRRRPDGVLEYLGRLDHQVKVRGFRVELGEIEAALARHPGVREAVVVARSDGSDRSLVAYVVGKNLAAAGLRSFLRESLPDFMIPTAFVELDALPLSASGKVDRKALPEPAAPAASPVAPAFRSPVEELLAGLVAEVLGARQVGPDDDFFALGGHSLLATRLLARVSRLLGVDLPVSAVFQHPTVAALAARIAAASGTAVAPPVLPVPRTDAGLPLSSAQRRLWFLDQMEPGSPAYHLAGRARLSGALAPDVLAAVLTEIARRHEALRTVFRHRGGEPAQVVLPAGAALAWIDLSALPAGSATDEAERLARAAALAPFDLARGPLWRALALRLAPDEHELVLVLHHIVADGWSLGIFLAELAALYETLAAGRPSPLAEPPVQYADWAVWQRERLRGELLETQTAWWRERLAGAPDLELPADRPRAVARSGAGGTRAAALPAALALELEGLARREGVTPFMLLLAAFQAQLARYTGAPAVPVGSPVANRARAEVEGVIGLFVNMLALRTPVDGDPDLRELLARVREVCLGAYAHQDVPFERLVEELRPERRLGSHPFFQTVFQLEEPLAVQRLGEVDMALEPLATGTAKFDLTLSVVRAPEGLAATLEYDADLFDPATADRLLGHWRTLVAGLADPQARLSGLPLLAPAEAAQIRAWSGVTAPYPRQATIHGLFAAVARQRPAAVALTTPEGAVSYADLDARSDRLAAHLRRLGVGPETPVGLCARRSPALVAGMLAILKAGGAYVPLDASYPAERLAWMAADSSISLLVVEEGLADLPALPPGVPRVIVSADGVPAGGCADGPLPETSGDGGSLAYVMYTSGST
ncbi:MAG: non-ribosomal peptide synthetase, partial [Acidobacteria bacterium]